MDGARNVAARFPIGRAATTESFKENTPRRKSEQLARFWQALL
jgi:hypothetical protein